jgi:hypothetical protein
MGPRASTTRKDKSFANIYGFTYITKNIYTYNP